MKRAMAGSMVGNDALSVFRSSFDLRSGVFWHRLRGAKRKRPSQPQPSKYCVRSGDDDNSIGSTKGPKKPRWTSIF